MMGWKSRGDEGDWIVVYDGKGCIRTYKTVSTKIVHDEVGRQGESITNVDLVSSLPEAFSLLCECLSYVSTHSDPMAKRLEEDIRKMLIRVYGEDE